MEVEVIQYRTFHVEEQKVYILCKFHRKNILNNVKKKMIQGFNEIWTYYDQPAYVACDAVLGCGKCVKPLTTIGKDHPRNHNFLYTKIVSCDKCKKKNKNKKYKKANWYNKYGFLKLDWMQ